MHKEGGSAAAAAGGSGGAGASGAGASATGARRRIGLRRVIFLTLLATGIVPLVVFAMLSVGRNRTLLVGQEQDRLAAAAAALSREMSALLDGSERTLTQIGRALLLDAGAAPLDERLRSPRVAEYLARAAADAGPDLLALRVLDRSGAGPRIGPESLPADAQAALGEAFDRALAGGRGAVFELAALPGQRLPAAAVAVPVATTAPGPGGPRPELVVEGLIRLTPLAPVAATGSADTGGAAHRFLIDTGGEILWSDADEASERALAGSRIVVDFVARPLSVVGQYEVDVGDRARTVLAQVSPVGEADWGVVLQRPLTAAYVSVRQMIVSTLVSSLVLVLLALFFAAKFAQRVSRPIQRLAETSHEIAQGSFGSRVEAGGLSGELVDLAEDFNRMSDGMAEHVRQLEAAARQNRELFLGTLRAFVAAIDAKDPYTRGHSERVAAVSRALAQELGLPTEQISRIWISALVHDVGKIGVDDSILKKGSILTEEEFARMKEHPTIGAEILAPIDQLKDTLPAVRWHHECWNGRGYPDGLHGEEIPLEARIVAVADTFDAITTRRPYQEAYTMEYAARTLESLAGSRFDAKVVTAFLSAHAGQRIPAPGSGDIAGETSHPSTDRILGPLAGTI